MNYKFQENSSTKELPTKKDIAWGELNFAYQGCEFRFQAEFKNGRWQKGGLTKEPLLQIHESSTALHYAQQCFEGMKAQTAKDGRALLFRPRLNWERMQKTTGRLLMPCPPEELFLEAISATVKANYAYLPPYGYGASLYVRPLLIGVGPNLGINKAQEYIFRVFTVPVGPYYKQGKIKPLVLKIARENRVAPKGIGSYKAGANYIAGLTEQYAAREQKYDEILFLDPLQGRFIEEAGSANVIAYFADKTLVTPKAPTILNSITRRSAMTIGKDYLSLAVSERPIDFYQEVGNILEMANCGTAAHISPVGTVVGLNGEQYQFTKAGKNEESVVEKLRQILADIQAGVVEDRYNWNYEIPL